MNESESQAARGPRHTAPSPSAGRVAEDRAEGVDRRPPEARPAANSASGGRGAGLQAAAPAPPPLLLASHAPRRRHAPPHSPRAPSPPPHTSITARLRRSPAPGQQSSTDPGGPEARCCLRSQRPLAELRAPLPGSAPPA